MKNNKKWIALFLAPSCVLFLLIYLLPIILLVFNSLFRYKLFPASFEFTGLGNYVELFTGDPAFVPALINTLLWILLHCTLHVLLGTALAFVLYKKPFGWKFVRVTYMIPNIISQAAIAMIFLNIFNPQFGALNGLLDAVGLGALKHNWLFEKSTAFPAMTMTWFLFAGYTTTLVLSQLMSVDNSLIEAARVDGAKSGQIDRMVMFPIVKKMIGTTVLMAAAYMLQLFSMIYITTGGGPGTSTTNLPLLLYNTMANGNYGYANAIGVFIIVLGAVCITLINRMFGMNKDES